MPLIAAGQLQFFGKHAALTNAQAFAAYLAPLRNSEWVVYSKRPFGGPEASVALSRPLHPSRRHLQSPPARRRPEQRHIQIQGLSDRGAGPLQDDDARNRRIHPPLPDARPPTGLPPHPLLRPARQRRPCRQHRARSRDARCAIDPDRRHQAPPPSPTSRKHQSIHAPAAAAA